MSDDRGRVLASTAPVSYVALRLHVASMLYVLVTTKEYFTFIKRMKIGVVSVVLNDMPRLFKKLREERGVSTHNEKSK